MINNYAYMLSIFVRYLFLWGGCMKLFLKSLGLSLIIFFICIIVGESILFSIILTINFFIIYFILTFLYKKYKVKILNKLTGRR